MSHVGHVAIGYLVLCVICFAALGLLLAWSERGHAQQPEHTICVSAIGPVDAEGHGDTTPELACTP